MNITLPQDAARLKRKMRRDKKRFAFSKEHSRMILPREVMTYFDLKKYGLDIWVSKEEKSIYLEFVEKSKAQFNWSTNGYVGCKDLFEWLEYQEMPVFDDYEYTNYQIDVRHKIVKLKLERE